MAPTSIAIYFLIWWIVLFAVLPGACGRRAEGGGCTGHRSRVRPSCRRLMSKLLWTTIAAAVVWAICAVLYAKGLVTLDGLASVFGFPAQIR